MIKYSLPVFLLFLFSDIIAQRPARKAAAGVMLRNTDSIFVVDSIVATGTFAKSGIRKGDRLVSINESRINKVEDIAVLFLPVREGDIVSIQYNRSGKLQTEKIKAVGKPLITSGFADVLYDWVDFRNGQLRTVTYKPKTGTNHPAILLIPGYGCSSIENYPLSYNGKLLSEWVKAGFVVVTIEKSGMGDSYGCIPCVEVDLKTDIESFDRGYQYMQQLSFVDKSRLFIWGHSMGGTIAPEIAKRHQPKGVMVFACVFRPWSEFLLEMHRVQKPLMEGLSYQQTEEFIRTIQKIYYEFFVLKKSLAQLHEIPEYKTLVETELNYKPGNSNMWGRHWRFWQQMDSVNLAQSWQQLNCPVLILHGESDYEQCSIIEPFMIRETVNEKHSGFATWITIPELDHFMMKSRDRKEAYRNFRDQQYLKGNFNKQIANVTVEWLKKNSQ
jgi:uncharacterized protein